MCYATIGQSLDERTSLFVAYWAALLGISVQNGSMIEVELGTSAVLLAVGVMYWISGGGLILAVEKLVRPEDR